ncbi:DUF2167 domain-containing protein [Ancylobacter terrae]|uniref:DUF2167 domain-containing protein n=1 Tax=Ancylobacter sp. sgz301288 TaxID=3342077 RepID=UPI00385F7B9C
MRWTALALVLALSAVPAAGVCAQTAPAPQATSPATSPGEPPASTPAEPALTPIQIEAREAWRAAMKAAIRGPSTIPLPPQGTLELPAGYLFVPKAEAGRFMRSIGNSERENLAGIIMSTDDTDWFATLAFYDEGYIRDDDARNWDTDALLQELREGTDAANEDRVRRGFPPLDIIGWVEKPTYDAATHRLVWSMSAHDRGSPPQDASVNYNSYALGREGYFDLNLISSVDAIEADKKNAPILLEAIRFADGKGYESFNASTDKVAAYGIAALVAGVGAKKLGLFAIIAGFAAKFAKVILFAVIAFGAGVFRWFRRTPPEGGA